MSSQGQFKQQQQPPRLQQDGPAISSMSLGRAWSHNLTHKLDMAQKYGYKGLELFYEDLEYFSRELEQERLEKQTAAAAAAAAASSETDTSSSSSPSPSSTSQDRTRQMLHAAHVLRTICDARDIKIISMQPFYHYEGLLDRELHHTRITALKTEWLPIAHILGTDLILIPSNFLPEDQLLPPTPDNQTTIISDLQLVADLGQQCTPPVRFCYESLAWGARSSRWQDSWSVVQQVDRPNFGICLDAFNITGLVFADPASPSGQTADAHDALTRTVAELTSTFAAKEHLDKIFIVQVADAERLGEPLVPGHEFYDASQPARMSWSRNCRVFYGEQEGYLPVKSVLNAIVNDLGYTGWISAELFNKRSTEADLVVPEEMASRGQKSWAQFERDFHLVTDVDDDSDGSVTVVDVMNDNEPLSEITEKLQPAVVVVERLTESVGI